MQDKVEETGGVRFPFINLQKALDRAKFLFESARGNDVFVKGAFDTWHYSEKSSGGFQTISALKMYGLIEDYGTKEARKIRFTENAKRYFLEEREENKERLKRNFALHPKLIKVLWNQWGDNPPADNIARSQLKLERDLGEQASRTLLNIYKQNLDFAVLKGEEISYRNNGEKDKPEDNNGEIKDRKDLKTRMGEREISSGLLSRESTYRLIVSGVFGEKEIKRLIAKLKLDEQILADQDEDNDDIPAGDNGDE